MNFFISPLPQPKRKKRVQNISMCKHFSTMCSLLYSFKFHSYTWILLQFICNMAAAQVLIKKKKKMMPSKLELLVVS